jgi:hypothetical protein
MDSAAVLGPFAEGVKVTVMVQLAPAATEVPQVFVWAKSALLLPPMVIPLPLNVRVPVPVLVRVTFCGWLGVPTLTFPKLRLVVDKLTLGVDVTVKVTPLLAIPLTVTTTLPEVAPVGTGATIEVALQLVGVAAVLLKVTVLVPWVAPKFVPVMVTEVPTGPEVGDRLVMLGAGETVKVTPLLATVFTVTTTLPEVAPLGTGATIEVALQLVGVAAVPLKVTVLVPWVEPKFAPLMVTEVPTGPEVGDRLVMLGADETVKVTPLLATVFTVTTTLPEVAPLGTGATIEVVLQLVGVAAVPLKVTVLVPWVEPKFVPVIVTEVPTGPEVGERLVMLGGPETVKVTPLLATPPTVTTTLPVVAPVGTGATIEVALQLVGVAAVPLKVTVLLPWVAPKFAPLMVTEVPTCPEVGERLAMLGPAGSPPTPQLPAGSWNAKAPGVNAPLTHIASFPGNVLVSHVSAFSSKQVAGVEQSEGTEDAMLKLEAVSSAKEVVSTAQT